MFAPHTPGYSSYLSVHEDSSFRTRVDVIHRRARALSVHLRDQASTMYAEMAESITTMFTREIACVNALVMELRAAIEAQRKLQYELVLHGTDFIIDKTVLTFPIPAPTAKPIPMEASSRDMFTVAQLHRLALQFLAIAPSGFIVTRRMVELLRGLLVSAAGTNSIPDAWLGVCETQLLSMCGLLAPVSDCVNWRLFVFFLAGIAVPTLENLMDLQQQCWVCQRGVGYARGVCWVSGYGTKDGIC